jgi:hypothetical protein
MKTNLFSRMAGGKPHYMMKKPAHSGQLKGCKDYTMSRSELGSGEPDPKPRQKKKKTGSASGWTFVNVSLTRRDKEALQAWIDDNVDLWSEVLRQVDNGYKISLTWEERSDGFLATMAGRSCIPENRNRILSGRGRDPQGAVASVLYKHLHLSYDGIWPGDDGLDGEFG